MTKKPEDLMKEMSRLLQEIKILSNRKEILSEQILSISAKNALAKAESIANAWGRAYQEFKAFRPLLRDIFSTYNMPVFPKRSEKYEKSKIDITELPVEVLANHLKWTASRFVTEFQQHLVKKSGDLKGATRDVIEAAQKAETLQDENLIRKVGLLNAEYLPFDLSIGSHLYASLTEVLRYSQAIVDKFVPEDQKLGRPPRGGGPKTMYKPSPLSSPEEVEQNAREALDHISTFLTLTEPIAEVIIDLVSDTLKMDTSKQAEPVEVEGEEEPSMEPDPVPDPTTRHKKQRWLDLPWVNDSKKKKARK